MDDVQAEPTKRCPFCGEQILAIAIKCKHCGSMLGAAPTIAPAMPPAPAASQAPVAVPPPALEKPAVPRPPMAIREGTLWFVVGALPGFILFGLLFIAGLFHYRGGLSSLSFGLTMEKLVVMVPIFAVVLGLPAGLSFATAMRKGDTPSGSGNVLVVGGVVTVALALAFGLLLEVFMGGEVENFTWLVAFAGITAFGGAALANSKGRRVDASLT